MSIFREYDIRGIADRDLTPQVVWSIGRVLAKKISEGAEHKAIVGQDVRLSSPHLAATLRKGLEDGGVEVLSLAPGPTPLLYFSAYNKLPNFSATSGIMITGSHNPPEYNGFKMLIYQGTIYGDYIQEMAKMIPEFIDNAPTEYAKEEDYSYENIEDLYVNFVKENITLKKKIKVVVDGGNGAGGLLGVKTYKAIGCEVIPLFCDPDGTFPNHHPDPTVPKNLRHLQEKVKEHSADVGIAYDGDGDRIGAVTNTGRVMYGDQLLLYFARDLLETEPGATIISEVKSSQILYDKLSAWGAKPIMWKTGHSLIKAQMKETGALLAGEMSGHMFFAHRFFGFDDAIYSGARLLEGMSQKEESLDEFMASLPPSVNTPELRVDCPDDRKFQIVEDFCKIAKEKFGNDVNDIDGARVKIHNGWGLMRASNTQPVLVMRFESDNEENLRKIQSEFTKILNDIGGEIKVPDIL